MISVRHIAGFLFYPARLLAWMISITIVYTLVVFGFYTADHSLSLPLRISDQHFEILFPFTNKIFLLGDYTPAYLVSNSITLAFYACFLWLLSNVFHVFKQTKLFTKRGVTQLSRFYITNLVFPFIFIGILFAFRQQIMDVVQVIFLHLVIGVFAYFMAAIFRQGLLLQEEQDLTF
jgi:hypothetical protein